MAEKPTVESFLGLYVKYDREGQYFWGIHSNEGHQMVAELRGWGAIQNLFKSNGKYNIEDAALFQDELGEWIADAINTKLNGLTLQAGNSKSGDV